MVSNIHRIKIIARSLEKDGHCSKVQGSKENGIKLTSTNVCRKGFQKNTLIVTPSERNTNTIPEEHLSRLKTLLT